MNKLSPREYMEYLVKSQALNVFQAVWTPLIFSDEITEAEVNTASNLWLMALDLSLSDPAMAKELRALTVDWIKEVVYKDNPKMAEKIINYDKNITKAVEENADQRPELLARAIKDGLVSRE